MSDVESLAAVDPTTDPAELARLAVDRPDLRAGIASNPAAYDGLLDWLGQLGDPQVNSVLAVRRGAAPAPAPVAPPAPQYVAAPVAPKTPWHEPTRDLPLRWGSYVPRYVIALALLSLMWLVPYQALIYPLADSGGLDNNLVNLILRIALCVSIVVALILMPAPILRRLIAAGIALVGVVYLFAPILDYLYGLGLPESDPRVVLQRLGAAIVTAGVPLAIWFVLRQRPGITFAIAGIAALPWFALTFIEYNDGTVATTVNYVTINVLIVGGAWLARVIHAKWAPRAAMPVVAPVPPTGTTNTMAVLALVFGVGGGLLGIVFGHLARAQIRRTGEQGWALATVGLVLGYVGLAAWVILIIVYVAVIMATSR